MITKIATKIQNLAVYDPPLALDKLPKHLVADPVHYWRAKNGIELIHEEPSWDEYQRISKNWKLMSPEQKKLSDAKAIEFFGVDNMTYKKQIRDKMLQKRRKLWGTK